MCLADFDSYFYTHGLAAKDWENTSLWTQKSLLNTAASGAFSSDGSIKKYAEEIWNVKPVSK